MAEFHERACALIALLKKRNLTIAAAESCTGGAFVSALVRVPGASDVVRGGVIAYCDDVKVELLGVDPAAIKGCGVVSEQVATQMAAGVRQRLRADIGVGVTGYAHTGRVCFAVSVGSGGAKGYTENFGCIGRVEVIDASVAYLVKLISEKI